MTYTLSERLFVENGPANTARRIHRRHDALRHKLAKADNDTAVSECAIRVAL